MKSPKHLLCCAVACLVVMAAAPSASAAIESRAILKTFFETGDVPTQDQFKDLIDSFIHQTDDGLSITGIGSSSSTGSRNPDRHYANDLVSAALDFEPVGGPSQPVPLLAPTFGGQSGFLALELSDSANTYFGYFQLSMDNPAVVDPAGIHVDYFVFDNVPNESLTIAEVPEPATLSLLAVAGGIILARRRRK